ncbi:MAG: hypothetical protein KGK17_01885 [Betaproteobacteria bacterium]|nr:hypothetical protein [Betaproteobacteria bacterium]
MQKKSIVSRGYLLVLVGGMLTGMGNGSVFGIALMSFLGRGGFPDWGGWYGLAYDPHTFSGFIDWCMIVFGMAYVVILSTALVRHNALENAQG